MAFVTSSPVLPRPHCLRPCSLAPSIRSVARPRCANPAHLRRRLRAPTMDLLGTGIYSPDTVPSSVRVVIFGPTGYIGRYVVQEFVRRGYRVTAFARSRSGVGGKNSEDDVRADFPGATVIFGDVGKVDQLSEAFKADPDNDPPVATVVVSCLASRTGGIADSNAIDYAATLNALTVGRQSGANHFILLSAVCVQKPKLEFQRAKLRFEAELEATARADPSFSYSIVRPTAFFKSLAGQVDRMKKGAAFVMFGDGNLCKCNPISERDLASFMTECATDGEKRNQILPVGGPGEPVSPLQQSEIIFRLLDKTPKYIRLPIGLMDGAIGFLDFVARIFPGARDAAEFGRIGRYYAVEDMIGPSYGSDTLEDFFAKAAKEGLRGQELGDATIF